MILEYSKWNKLFMTERAWKKAGGVSKNTYEINDRELIFDYIKRGFDPDTRIANDDSTVLIAASMTEDEEMCEVLVKAGANLDHHNKSNTSPLGMAIFKQNVDIVKILLDAGANMYDTNIFKGYDLIEYVMNNNYTDIFCEFLEHGINIKPYLKNVMDDNGEFPMNYNSYRLQMALHNSYPEIFTKLVKLKDFYLTDSLKDEYDYLIDGTDLGLF